MRTFIILALAVICVLWPNAAIGAALLMVPALSHVR